MLVVLDVNETLSDMSPMREVFIEAGLADGDVAAWFAGVLRDGFALTIAGENPAFADLAADSLRTRLAGRDPIEVEAAVEQVMGAFMGLEPHPEVADAIGEWRTAGDRVVTLSNGSAPVAEGVLRRAGARDQVEAVLSVADAPAWKPHRSAYHFALEVCGVRPEEAMLVAVHPWDIDGAARAGLRTGWVNRDGSSYPAAFRAPDLQAPDLLQLARTWG